MDPAPAVADTARDALDAPEVHPILTDDGVEVRLTRYHAGDKGPIVLAPGYGNAARVFHLDTVPTSWVAFLAEHGYDIWLLDYRASPALVASAAQFTVDDIALRDWPAAVARVREVTGADTVQAMGHCVGGLSLFMALGGGMEGVRSVTFSALAGNPVPTLGNKARAAVRLASLFRLLGISGLSPDYDARSLPDRAVEAVMRLLPFRHVYDSPTARRIFFIYGDVFEYSNIDRTTMDEAVPLVFGSGNMTFFEHISLMIRAGEARDAAGEDAYWGRPDAYRLPMHFITGEGNRMFVPEGLRTSYDRLRSLHGDELYRHDVLPGYAHLDLWLGTDAERDVYPTALAELERHNPS